MRRSKDFFRLIRQNGKLRIQAFEHAEASEINERSAFMEEKFAAAAVRHYGDADTLAASERLDGAGHLIGFCAECAIKHAVISLRADIDSLHGHFPDLINVAKRHLNQRLHHGLYTIIKSPVFMQGWEVGSRYSEDGTVTRQNYELWRGQARSLMFAAKLRG